MTVPVLRGKLPKIRWDSKASAVVQENNLNLDSDFFTYWTLTGVGPVGAEENAGWWTANPTNVTVSVAALFMWLPDVPPLVRESTATRVLTGLTPGTLYGFTLNTNWIVHVDWGRFQVIMNGVVYEMPTTGNTLWNYGTVDTTENRYLSAVADGAGEIEIKLRFYEFRPSFNVHMQIKEGQLAIMEPSDLLFVMPAEGLTVHPKPLEPQQRIVLPSGVRDGWEADWVDQLECVVRAIPTKGNLPDGTAYWGWEGNGGWAKFLEYASTGGHFQYFPDQDDELTFYECELVEALVPKPDPDWAHHQQIRLAIRTTTNTPIVGY